MSSPLNIWDGKEQKYVPLPCLKGENGKDGTDGYTPQKGVDYFTDEDIASLNIPSVDQTYTPDSENAQSGKAVAEAVAIEQKRSDNTFANALKSSKSGSAILIDDVSPVTHKMSVKISSDTVTDLTSVTVSKCGKNLWCDDYDKYTHNVYNIYPISLPKGDYYVSINKYGSETVTGVTVGIATSGDDYPFNNSLSVVLTSSGVELPQKITVTDDIWTAPKLAIFATKADWEKFFANYHLQLEVGSTATDYEPYVEPTEYRPNADGTVNGVTSLYPNTTLMTDTNGVIINCEYNKDINKFSGVDVDVPTKTSELINDSNFATQDYVDEEIANFDFIKIVTELPATGLVNRTYFVPKEDPNTNDLYDEYMWVDGKWELITTKQIEVDLTKYVKNTDINQSYDPLSENAQSGKAVAEAMPIEKGNGIASIRHKVYDNLADGENSVSLGLRVHTYNLNGISIGRENENYSHCGVTLGYKNIAGCEEYKNDTWDWNKGLGCIALGWGNIAAHGGSYVSGFDNISSALFQAVFGKFCAENPDARLIIGNGTNLENRSNLLEITDTDIILKGVAYPKKETGKCKLSWGDTSTSKYHKVGDLVSICYNHSTDSSIIVSSLSGLPFALSGNYDADTLAGQGFLTLNGMCYPIYAKGYPNSTNLSLEIMVDNVLQNVTYQLLEELGGGTVNLQLNIQYFTEV